MVCVTIRSGASVFFSSFVLLRVVLTMTSHKIAAVQSELEELKGVEPFLGFWQESLILRQCAAGVWV